jgi:hypothetical protein
VYAACAPQPAGRRGRDGPGQLGIAIPNFWFAILLILLFSVKLQWFSRRRLPGLDRRHGGGPLEGLKALLLPAMALAVVQAAILARITRSAVLEVLREDFVRTARAKGLSRRAALWGHVLRNAMIPVVTVMGLQFANLLAGTIVVENVFYLPGLGRLIFQSIANRDLIVVRNCVMLLAAMVVVVNFCRGRAVRGDRPPREGQRYLSHEPVESFLPRGGRHPASSFHGGLALGRAGFRRQVPSAGERNASHVGTPPGWLRALRHRSFVLGAVLTRCCWAWPPVAGLDALVALRDGLARQAAAAQRAALAGHRCLWPRRGVAAAGGRAQLHLVGVIAVGIGLGVGTALGLLAAARAAGWKKPSCGWPTSRLPFRPCCRPSC